MSKVWCALPWIHQFITTTGIKTCCASIKEVDCSPIEFKNSDYLKEVKTKLLNDQPHSQCKMCYDLENQGFTSIRQETQRNYPHYTKDNIPNEIEYLELRYNNLCNFSCKMCSPDFSSSIGKLVDNNPKLTSFYYRNIPRQNKFDQIYKNIESNLSNIKKINFAGGEPLLNKDNIKILKKLIELKNTDCEICIITNASALNPEWVELVKHFRKTHWTISVDGVGPVGEYIRVGTNWKNLENNIHTILELDQSVAINTTLSAYSVLDLLNTVKFFVSLKQIRTNQLEQWFGLCQFPVYLQPSLLYGQYAQKSRTQLEKSIELLSTIQENPKRSLIELQNVLDSLETQNNKNNVKQFIEYTKIMDQVHNMSFESVFNLENPYV
jgi:uncharacterized radical SAM superfamily Fe-S cluster-containing enzyme